jgi:peptide chain release factor 2
MFDLPATTARVQELEKKVLGEGFWQNTAEAPAVLKELDRLKASLEEFASLQSRAEDLEVHLQLAEEEDAAQELPEIERGLQRLSGDLHDVELGRMLSEPDDGRDAILTIHPGAGGLESQDWAQMLMRMYMRWAEEHGYTTDILDYQPGEGAGIKRVGIEVSGTNAYGYLKTEMGVHRLVRISPFDANHRRHTSFASVFVYPEVDEDIEVEIRPEDLKVDTFRASGAGGQHVNKTSSAVRISHLPTGIVVQCQSERSQHRNRLNAMKLLRSKLYQRLKEEEEAKRAALESSKKEIAWGSQIRSYVMHPYTMVKDHRTGVEKGDVEAVMDGDIDQFVEAYLQQIAAGAVP